MRSYARATDWSGGTEVPSSDEQVKAGGHKDDTVGLWLRFPALIAGNGVTSSLLTRDRG
jgi:hypothetical protein